jgi:hypothetical protein
MRTAMIAAATGLMAALAVSAPARADITFYDAFVTRFLVQNTPAAPDFDSGQFRFSARIFSDTPGDLATARLLAPNAAMPIDFVQASPTLFTVTSSLYPDYFAFLGDWPWGVYEYRIAGGALGSRAAEVRVVSDHYGQLEAPALTPASFISLTSAFDVGQGQTIEFNTWTPDPIAPEAFTFVTVFGPGGVEFNQVVLPTDTSVTIPANTLTGDTDYVMAIVFSSRFIYPNEGFVTATAVGARDTATDIAFRTAPGGGCVADVDDGSGTGTPDGGVGVEDLLYYLQLFESGDVGADVDDGSGTGTLDGGVGIEDLLYYLVRFDLGC